jgi:hypothetical protein
MGNLSRQCSFSLQQDEMSPDKFTFVQAIDSCVGLGA